MLSRAATEAQHMVQELQIHQIELELQNEELRHAKTELEALLEKYTDLYDFAPTGYFSLDENGVVREANLTGASLLRVERALLVGRRFALFLAPAARANFAGFLSAVRGSPTRQSCEVLLISPGRAAFWAEFHGLAVPSPDAAETTWCRLAVSDATERRRAEEARRHLDALAATNRGLESEIARRRTVESALTKSEAESRQLLEQSRSLQQKLRLVSNRILLVQEEQRKKLSRELHDDISQLLVGIVVHMSNFAKAAATNPEEVRRGIPPLRRLVEKSVRVVHRFARELRPAMLDDLGLVAALEAYIADFPKVKGRRIVCASGPGADRLDNVRRTALYRVAQEAITNAHKYARARVISVSVVEVDGRVSLEVQDDGRGFDVGEVGATAGSHHLGLIGMRERVEMAGGRFTVVSAIGAGTTIRAEVPTARARKSPRGYAVG